MSMTDDLNLFFEDPLLLLDKAGIPDTNPNLLGTTCKKYSTLYLLLVAMSVSFSILGGCTLLERQPDPSDAMVEQWHYRKTWGLPEKTQPFNQDLWIKHDNKFPLTTSHRWEMFQDLVEKQKLVGMSESQVSNLLGRPSQELTTNQYWERWRYSDKDSGAYLWKPFVRQEWTAVDEHKGYLPLEKSTLQDLKNDTVIWDYYLSSFCGTAKGVARGNYTSDLQLLFRNSKCERVRIVFARYWSSHGP